MAFGRARSRPPGGSLSPLIIAGALAAGLIALLRRKPVDQTPEPNWQPIEPT